MSHVTLEILDGHGERVRLLAHRLHDPGDHAVLWDGRDDAGNDVAGGAYLVRMTAYGGGGRAFIQSRPARLVR